MLHSGRLRERAGKEVEFIFQVDRKAAVLFLIGLFQLFVELTAAFAAGFRLLAVHAEVFGNIILIGPELQDHSQFGGGLEKDTSKDRYGNKRSHHLYKYTVKGRKTLPVKT